MAESKPMVEVKSLIEASAAALDASGPKECEAKLKLAVSTAQTAGDNAALGTALHAMLSFKLTGASGSSDTAAALQLGTEAISAFNAAGLTKESGEVHLTVADVYFKSGQPQEAMSSLEDAKRLATDSGNKAVLGLVLQRLGVTYFDMAQADEALASLDEAQAAYQDAKDGEAAAKVANTKAQYYLSLDMTAQALQIAKDAVQDMRDASDDKGLASALLVVESVNKEADATGKSAEEALSIYKKLGEKKKICDAMVSLCESYATAGMTQDEAKWAEEAKKSAEGEKEQAAVLEKLAMMYFQIKEADKAMKAAEQAASIYKQLSLKGKQVELLHNIFKGQAATEVTPAAKKALSDAVQIFRKAGDVEGEALELLYDTETYLALGRYEAASKTAREALAACRKTGDLKGQAAALNAISNSEMRQDNGMAIRAAEDLIAVYNELGDEEGKAAAYLALANANLTALDFANRRCSIPSKKFTVATAQAVKSAYSLCESLKDSTGMEAATATLSAAISLNQVNEDSLPTRDPFSLCDMLESGNLQKYAELPPVMEQPKVSGAAFNRSSFKWRDASAGWCYTLCWEPLINDLGLGPKYDCLAIAPGGRMAALPIYHQLRPVPGEEVVERGNIASCMVCINSLHSSVTMGNTWMSHLNSISSMVIARVPKLIIVQTDEHAQDHSETKMRQIACAPATLSMLRSARLEAPYMGIGYVAADLMTWMNNREQVIASCSDVLQTQEVEIMWNKGTKMVPNLIHREMKDVIDFAKPTTRPK